MDAFVLLEKFSVQSRIVCRMENGSHGRRGQWLLCKAIYERGKVDGWVNECGVGAVSAVASVAYEVVRSLLVGMLPARFQLNGALPTQVIRNRRQEDWTS